MAKTLFSNTQTNFLIKNYPTKGLVWCTEQLPFTKEQILSKVGRLGLKLNYDIYCKSRSKLYPNRPQRKTGLRLDIENIFSFKDPKSNYILGFLWGDGWISKIAYRVCFQFLKEDYLNLAHCFDSWGKWHTYFKNKSKNNITRKDSVDLSGNSEFLYNFLANNDYGNKSTCSPYKILQSISIDQHHFFWRGYIDADGCWYYNEKNILRQFSLAGSYNQDWSSFENLCRNLDIKYTIQRREQFSKVLNKTTRSSCCRITGKYNLLRLGQYVYPNGFDKIGLKRKYDVYRVIIDSIKRW